MPAVQPRGRSKIRSLVNSGQRAALDERTGLGSPVIRLVEIVSHGSSWKMVPDMALGDDLATVRFIVARLEAAGYTRHPLCWMLGGNGVPQHRQRLILVATRDGFVHMPSESRRVTLRDAIGDRRAGRHDGEPEMCYGGSRSAFQRTARRWNARFAVWDHVTRPVR